MTYGEGRAMAAAVEQAGVRSQIGLVLRYSAVYTVMRQLVRDPRAVSRWLSCSGTTSAFQSAAYTTAPGAPIERSPQAAP